MVKNQLQRFGMMKAVRDNDFGMIGRKPDDDGFVFFEGINVHAVDDHPYFQKAQQNLIFLGNDDAVCRR